MAGIELHNVPTTYYGDDKLQTTHAPTPQRESFLDMSRPEPTEYGEFRKTLIKVIQPHLDENQSIPDNSSCPLPCALVRLELDTDKAIMKREYPIPQAHREFVDQDIFKWVPVKHKACLLGNRVTNIKFAKSTQPSTIFMAKPDYRYMKEKKPVLWEELKRTFPRDGGLRIEK